MKPILALKVIIGLFIAFLVIGAYLIVLNNDIDLRENEGKETFVYKFSEWAWHSAVNTKNIIGYAISLQWLPDGNEDNDVNDKEKSKG